MIPGSANPLLLKSAAAAAGGYQVSRSLRFNSSDSASCARTFSSGSSTTTQTLSLWVKRAKLGATGCFWGGYDGSAAYGAYFQFESSDALTVILGGASLYQLTTTQVFRDPSSWYHIVLTIDTNNGTSGDRIRLYVNGSRVTTFSTASYPTSGYGCQFALGNANNKIGTTWGSSAYSFFDGYLADIHFIDGQALTPSSFTEVSATTGQLIPKAYSGSFGTNGFWLKFSDNSAATAATLGKDYSGNSNNWTPNNLSVTAGAGNDSLVDTPTSYGTDTGVGGEVRGNYATFNPLNKHNASDALSNGNLDLVAAGGSAGLAPSTIGVSSGKWYCEFVFTGGTANDLLAGIRRADSRNYDNSYLYRGNSNLLTNGSVGSNYGSGFVLNDVVGVAFDADNGKLFISVNGTFTGSGNPVTGANPAFSSITGTYNLIVGTYNNICNATVNFGQRAFAHPVSGFKALCDTNLPAPLTAKPNTLMDVVTYTGNGSTQSIAGLAFSPDFAWFKRRDSANNHALFDIVRGSGKFLISSDTGGEGTDSNSLISFDTSGFTIGQSVSAPSFNITSGSYVAWSWDAGTSTVSNTAGSITSQVRANVSAGFSVVTYTGSSAGSTVGHGLGVAPAFIIGKRRDGASEWSCYHQSLGNAQAIILNTTAAASSSSTWNSTSPTSSVVTLGAAFSVNYPSYTHVLYCFAPVVGYSNGFSYTGNGSADGSFVYLGFRPRLIMLKRSDSTSNWTLLDTSREGYNVDNDPLYPNLSDAEGTTDLLDITSNGFKLRSTDASVNASAGTYIGFAWAEAPFAYSRAR